MTGWIERLASTTTVLSLTVSIFSINIPSPATSRGFAAFPMLRFELYAWCSNRLLELCWWKKHCERYAAAWSINAKASLTVKGIALILKRRWKWHVLLCNLSTKRHSSALFPVGWTSLNCAHLALWGGQLSGPCFGVIQPGLCTYLSLTETWLFM